MAPEKYNFEQEKISVPQKEATDMDLAAELIKHINDPCEDLHGNNIRDFYIREAERTLGTMKDPDAMKILKSVVDQYSKKENF